MNTDKFFSIIMASAKNEEEKIIELLKARGYLITSDQKKNYLTEGTIVRDIWGLRSLLESLRIGTVNDDGVIILSDTATASSLKHIFQNNQVRESMCTMGYMDSWRIFFSTEEMGHVAVHELEPFVARYVRALNSCGVYTIASCDGNHGKSQEIAVSPYGTPSNLWHQAICRVLMDKNMYPHLKWYKNCTKLRFTEETRYDAYLELNLFAKSLYRYKDVLLEIKAEIGKEIREQYDYSETEKINAVFLAKAIRHLRTALPIDQDFRNDKRLRISFDGRELEIPERYLTKYQADSRWLIEKAVKAGISREEAIDIFKVQILSRD